MNTKGMKFLAVLAVLAMAFAAVAVIAPDTGNDAADAKVTLTIVGTNGTVKEYDTVSEAIIALNGGSVDPEIESVAANLVGATAVKIQLGAAYAEESEALATLVPVTELDINGQDLTITEDGETLVVSKNLVIKDTAAVKGTITFGEEIVIVNPEEEVEVPAVQYYVAFPEVDGLTVTAGDLVLVPGVHLVDAGTAIDVTYAGDGLMLNGAATDADNASTDAIDENMSLSVGAAMYIVAYPDGVSISDITDEPVAIASGVQVEEDTPIAITVNYDGEGTLLLNGVATTAADLEGIGEVDQNIVITIDEPIVPPKTVITFDSVAVDMAGEITEVVNIRGDVAYSGTITNASNDVTFKSLAQTVRATLTFDATIADGTALAFDGYMLDIAGAITGQPDQLITVTTGDTTPSFIHFEFVTGDGQGDFPFTVGIADKLNVTGTLTVPVLELNGGELYVKQATALTVGIFVKTSDAIDEDERFGVAAGSTFAVGSIWVGDVDVSENSGAYTYNSYCLGTLIIGDEDEAEPVPMFNFVYTYKDGDDVVSKNLSLAAIDLIDNDDPEAPVTIPFKFPKLFGFNVDENFANYINGYNDTLMGWTDDPTSNEVKYKAGKTLADYEITELAPMYYPVLASQINNLMIEGTVTVIGPESAAGLEIVATPLAGEPKSATTNDDGSFIIEGLTLGTYSLSIASLEELDYVLTAGGSANVTMTGVTDLDVTYTQYVIITVDVSVGDDVPAEFADIDSIKLYLGENANGQLLDSSNLDTLQFVYTIPYSEETIDFYAVGIKAGDAVLNGRQSEVSCEASINVEIELKVATFTVSGTVSDNETAAPIEGVTVSLMIGDEEFASAVTDEDGKYSILDVENGTIFTLVIKNDDYYPYASEELTIETADVVENIGLDKAPWVVYLTIWYNGQKILPENYQFLVAYYDLDPILAMGDVPEEDVDYILDLENKVIILYLKTTVPGEEDPENPDVEPDPVVTQIKEPGYFYVKASSYNYIGSTYKYIEQNKESVDVVLGEQIYNIYGVVEAPAVDPQVDMKECITITANGEQFAPEIVRYNEDNAGHAVWEFYKVGLENQTTGDVAVAIADFAIYKPYKIESSDIGDWDFIVPNFYADPADVPEGSNPAMYIGVDLAPLNLTVSVVDGYTLEVSYAEKDENGELVPGEELIDIDQETGAGTFRYGANIAIVVAEDPQAVDPVPEQIVVKVNGETVMEEAGTYCIASVVEDLIISVKEPAVYTENLLVTVGQNGDDVVVVFTALDSTIDAVTTIPNVTVDLELNYSYINEFGDITAESFAFSVEYTEDQFESFEISDVDFAAELGDDYQYAFCVTGSYVYNEETVELSKTAYKPVEPEAEA